MFQTMKISPGHTVRFFLVLGTFLVLAAAGCSASRQADRSGTRSGYLGVNVEKLSLEDKKELHVDFGVLVVDVIEDGPADRADFREDDVIQFYNGSKIKKPEDLISRVRKTRPRTTVKISLVRDSKTMETAVEIGRKRFPDIVLSGPQAREFRMAGRVSPFLGVRMQEINADLADYFNVEEGQGVLVVEVEDDSPAQKAGIKAGDIIVQAADEKVEVPEDLKDALSEMEDGDKIEITLIRKGVKQTVQAELEEREFDFRFRAPDMSVEVPPMHMNSPRMKLEIPDVHVDVPEKDVDIPEIRVETPDIPEFDLRIEIDDDFKERLKERMETWKEEFEREMEKLKRDLRDLDVNIEI